MISKILSVLPGDHPWQNTLYHFDTIPSTNDAAKTMAKDGAPEGTVVVASAQSAGRGRLGRSFHAPDGLGLYFSLILRPNCPPEQLMHLTCAAGTAACDAVESICGVRPQIKWTNDLVVDGKKLGGILTELSVGKNGLVEWAVVGIGINCMHRPEDFPEDIGVIATSLLQVTGNSICPAVLAGALIPALHTMSAKLLTEKEYLMTLYRRDCMTLGKSVMLLRGEEKRYGTALDIDGSGSLVVRFDDGTIEAVQSGEISVRGLYGYA